jgi:hypothetical protein
MSEQHLVFAEESEQRPANEERRATVRYRSKLSASCHPISGGSGTAWRARVHDVSALGIGLVLSHPLEPGRLIEVNLERSAGVMIHSLLARVVHVQSVGSDWLVGSAFTAELDDTDLQLFQAARVPTRAGDCRRWVRFPCNVETVCYTCETAPGERAPARVLDISPGGIGLILPCEFPVGIILHCELPSVGGLETRKLLVRVVRAIEHANGDWFHGCEFAQRLGSEEVKQLL